MKEWAGKEGVDLMSTCIWRKPVFRVSDQVRHKFYSCNRIIPLVWIKKIFSHIRLGIRDGGQDTPAGVSWPPPTYFFFKSSINTTMISNCCILSCYHCDKIHSIGLNWKNYFTYLAWNQGWGSRYPSRGILTHNHLFVSKSSTKTICCQKLLQYFMLFL